MKKFMYGISIGSLALMFVFFSMFIATKTNACLILGVSAMTVAYHFIVRLAIINLCDVYCTSESMNPNERRFQPKKFEKGLYRALKVREWKDLFPNYDPNRFSLRTHSVDELIFESCKVEVMHWLCALAGFASLIFSVWFGVISIFIVTSVIGAIYDLGFVVTQRFNRPRLRKIAATGKYN